MNKKVLISLGSIALLLIIIFVQRADKSSNTPDISKWKDNADDVVIKKSGGETIHLFKKDNAWFVGEKSFPADKETVSKINDKLQNLELTDLISREPHYTRYDLTPEKSLEVTVKSSDTVLLHLFVGKKSSTQRHTFVRLGDKPEVYLATGNLADELNKKVENFRDKVIFKVSKNAVESFEINYKGKVINFKKIREEIKQPAGSDKDKKAGDEKKSAGKTVEQWICNGCGGIKLDQTKINAMLSSFEQLRANSFPAIDKKNLWHTRCMVTISAYNRNITLSIFHKDEKNKYLCTSSESEYVFTLDAYRAEKFMKQVHELREKPKR